MSAEVLAGELTRYACEKLRQHLIQTLRCAALLDDQQMWHRDNDNTNSVANLILHLSGNVGQWIVGGLGGRPAPRDRAAEFHTRGPLPRQQVLGGLQGCVEQALAVLEHLDDRALATRYLIQGYEVSGVVAVMHVVEHFAGHVGQIVHITKALRNVDLSLYDSEGRRLLPEGSAVNLP